MRLEKLLAGLEVLQINADLNTEILNITVDSRKVKPGDIFVALRGERTDGHKYITQSVLNGAAAVLCEEKPDDNIPYVLVENTEYALAVISCNFYDNPSRDLKLIGVTGTKGKTTTSTLIKFALEGITGKPVGIIGTNGIFTGIREHEYDHDNNPPTTPMAHELQKALRMFVDAGCQYAVMEVSSHALVGNRVTGTEFEIGVFTNLAHEHLDKHETMEKYAEAKSRLFAVAKHAVINVDDKYAGLMAATAVGDVWTYSLSDESADVIAKRVRLEPKFVQFAVLTLGALEQFKISIPGEFTVYNALACITTLLRLGFEIKDIANVLAQSKGVVGRIEVVPIESDYAVVIDYAHTPDSLEKVITALKNGIQGRLIVVFGCGGDRDTTKRPLMGRAVADNADIAVVTSDNPRTEDPGSIIEMILDGMSSAKCEYTVIPNRREAIAYAMSIAKTGDIVLLAGKGQETYQIIGHDRIDFDERVIVSEIFKELKKGQAE